MSETERLFRLQKTMYGTVDAGFFGYSHFTGGYAGGQAEYVRVPKGSCLVFVCTHDPDAKNHSI